MRNSTHLPPLYENRSKRNSGNTERVALRPKPSAHVLNSIKGYARALESVTKDGFEVVIN